MEQPQIKIADVGPSLGGSQLRMENGVIVLASGDPIVQHFDNLADWKLVPAQEGAFPTHIGVGAKLFLLDYSGNRYWIAEVYFIDMETSAFASLKTFRVDFPNGMYDSGWDSQLAERLRLTLVGLDPEE